MRLRRKPWIDSAIREFDSFVFSRDHQPEDSIKGHWRDIFPQTSPVHLEIGTGKGDFIAQMAQNFPKVNFIGLEVAQDVLYTAARKIAALELANVRLIVFDAARLTDLFAPGEVEMLYLNFSDPWPKKRHAKRRLTHRDFLARYRQILAPTGKICFKTDNLPLFEFSLSEFHEAGMELTACTYDLHGENTAEASANAMTEYEKKFSAAGNKICRVEAFWPEEVRRLAGTEKILE